MHGEFDVRQRQNDREPFERVDLGDVPAIVVVEWFESSVDAVQPRGGVVDVGMQRQNDPDVLRAVEPRLEVIGDVVGGQFARLELDLGLVCVHDPVEAEVSPVPAVAVPAVQVPAAADLNQTHRLDHPVGAALLAVIAECQNAVCGDRGEDDTQHLRSDLEFVTVTELDRREHLVGTTT